MISSTFAIWRPKWPGRRASPGGATPDGGASSVAHDVCAKAVGITISSIRLITTSPRAVFLNDSDTRASLIWTGISDLDLGLAHRTLLLPGPQRIRHRGRLQRDQREFRPLTLD